jgi:hypothetical protein
MLKLQLFANVKIMNHHGTCSAFLHHGSYPKAGSFAGEKSKLVPDRKAVKYKISKFIFLYFHIQN